MNDQFRQAASSLDQMRHWLTDVMMLEPTIRRAMTTLEPLTELGNLRRISGDELRQAARVVRDMRRAEQAGESVARRSADEVDHAMGELSR